MLNINQEKNGSVLTIGLEGRLDTTTSPQLEEFVTSNITGVTELYFDMAKLEYVSSAGLRVLLSTQKKMNAQGKMILKNVSEEVLEVFEVTGFTDILTIQK